MGKHVEFNIIKSNFSGLKFFSCFQFCKTALKVTEERKVSDSQKTVYFLIFLFRNKDGSDILSNKELVS